MKKIVGRIYDERKSVTLKLGNTHVIVVSYFLAYCTNCSYFNSVPQLKLRARLRQSEQK